jgi:large repetitive protein
VSAEVIRDLRSAGPGHRAQRLPAYLLLAAFQHVVLTQSGATTRFYLNGTLNAETTTGPTIASPTSQSLYIGTEARHWTDVYYSGALDDIRLYDRALTASEVLALYHEDGWGS